MVLLIGLAHSHTRNKAMAIGNSMYVHLSWIFSAVNGHLLVQAGRLISLLVSSVPLDAGKEHTFSLLGLPGHQSSGCHLLWRYQLSGSVFVLSQYKDKAKDSFLLKFKWMRQTATQRRLRK